MPRIERVADLTWEGNTARGNGTMTAGSGAFESMPFSLPSRIERVAGKTSPEELLAAAHGGCFTTSFSTELTKAGTPPERLDVRVTVEMDEVEGKGHQVVSSHVDVRGRVPGADAESFARAATEADEGCPFSTLIKASARVTYEATLLDD